MGRGKRASKMCPDLLDGLGAEWSWAGSQACNGFRPVDEDAADLDPSEHRQTSARSP